jgi:PhzF family phenazine biosynthesis protein
VTIPLFTVDAFTPHPFAGNPAAVCPLDRARDDDWLQRVAAEMNLSETAFLLPENAGYRLRWFTPAVEVDLCGHATLASAHVLWQTGRVANGKCIRFFTRSGTLTAEQNGDWIELDFPALPVTACEAPADLASSLGVRLAAVGRSRMDYLCEVIDEETLRGMTPDMTRLRAVQVRGVIVTCKSRQSEYDFLSRFFAPATGVDEDPVTGSSHCSLGPYWAAKLGKSRLCGYQASRRGGIVRVHVQSDRVRLGGQAVTVLRGELDA